MLKIFVKFIIILVVVMITTGNLISLLLEYTLGESVILFVFAVAATLFYFLALTDEV